MSIKVETAGSVSRADVASVVSINRAGANRSAPISGVPAVDTMRLTGEAVGLQRTEAQHEKSAVDLQKVERVRQQIADGTYKPNSASIAKAMIRQDQELLP